MNEPRKLLEVTVKAPSEDVIVFRASDCSRDRDGDKISPNGWEMDEFVKNPVFLWSHMKMLPPLGKGVDWRVSNNALEIDVKFAKKDTDYDDWPAICPSPETVRRMYKGGYLNAVSVGFIPLEHKQYDSPEARQAAGLGPWGVEYLKQKLLELSSVTVPSNPNALQLAVAGGIMTDKEAEVWLAKLAGGTDRLIDETVETLICRMKVALSEEETVKAVRKMLGVSEMVVTSAVAPVTVPEPTVLPAARKSFRELWDAVATTTK